MIADFLAEEVHENETQLLTKYIKYATEDFEEIHVHRWVFALAWGQMGVTWPRKILIDTLKSKLEKEGYPAVLKHTIRKVVNIEPGNDTKDGCG